MSRVGFIVIGTGVLIMLLNITDAFSEWFTKRWTSTNQQGDDLPSQNKKPDSCQS